MVFVFSTVQKTSRQASELLLFEFFVILGTSVDALGSYCKNAPAKRSSCDHVPSPTRQAAPRSEDFFVLLSSRYSVQ